MKTNKIMILVGLVCLAVLLTGYDAFSAKKTDYSNTGVVSIREIFNKSQRHQAHISETQQQQRQIEMELEKLAKEIEADEATLRTLKSDSDDYMELVKDVLDKRATLQSRREFYKQRLELTVQRWTEKFYQEILDAAGRAAEEKGLDMVLEKSQPQLPAVNANALMLTMSTHKLLYSGGCVDITEDVIAILDEAK